MEKENTAAGSRNSEANGQSHIRGQSSRQLVRTRGKDIVPMPLRPIWDGVLYRGKVTILAGLPGEGKSAITCDMVARITNGSRWPCTDESQEPSYAIMLTAEDDVGDTVRPRLDVAGANADRYEVITGAMIIDTVTGKPVLDAVSLIGDLPRIEAAIVETKASLLIVDPLTSFAERDTNKTVETRALLDSLAALANRTGCAVVIVTHLNKRSDARRALDLVAGSHVIAAAARAVYATARDPEDNTRRLMLPLKCNLAKGSDGYAYALVEAKHAVCGSMPRVEWEKSRYAGASADEALVDQAPRERARAQKAADVRAWLIDLLSAGPVPSEVLWRQAKDAGFTQKVVGEELRKLKAATVPGGFQEPWQYRMPADAGRVE